MKVKSIEISKLFSTGNFTNFKIGISVEISEKDSETEAIDRAIKFIDQYDPKNKVSDWQYNQALEVIKNKRHHTLGEIEDAEIKIKIYEGYDFQPF